MVQVPVEGSPAIIPQLYSERLMLRHVSYEDVDAICALANNWEVARWMSRLPYPYLKSNALSILQQVTFREIIWIIQDCSSTEIFGMAGLTLNESESVELGYWLGQIYWHKGFATEASQIILEFAFDTVFLSEIKSGCFIDNVRSIHVLEKLGFRVIGTSKRWCMAQAKELSHLDMLLTREMWISAQRGK